MKINCESGQFLTGLGDSITISWIAEGSKNTDDPIELFATGTRKKLLEILGQKVAENAENSIICSDAYRAELNDYGQMPRTEYIKQHLKREDIEIKRPNYKIPEEELNWAKDETKTWGEKIALLFPQTWWSPREWPKNYWIDLAWKLHGKGVKTIMMLHHQEEDYKNIPGYYYGFSIEKVAAMMKVASIVISNDSMPAHLGGTIEVPTLVLMGPTKTNIIEYIPNIEPMISGMLDCVGCHFGQPFRAACDKGCMSLYSLFPDTVLERALEIIEENKPKPIKKRKTK